MLKEARQHHLGEHKLISGIVPIQTEIGTRHLTVWAIASRIFVWLNCLLLVRASMET